jgi:hypothetical protein
MRDSSPSVKNERSFDVCRTNNEYNMRRVSPCLLLQGELMKKHKNTLDIQHATPHLQSSSLSYT